MTRRRSARISMDNQPDLNSLRMRSSVSGTRQPGIEMLRRVFLILAVLLIGALLAPGAARANYTTPHAELVCQKGLSVALVRFTLTVDEDRIAYRRLPVRVDEGLSATR